MLPVMTINCHLTNPIIAAEGGGGGGGGSHLFISMCFVLLMSFETDFSLSDAIT